MTFKNIIRLPASGNIQGPMGGSDLEPPFWAQYVIY